MTSMLGSESAGPASSSASAGPWPMPEPRSVCRIGTSVRVAKYMSAPTNEARKLAPSELPPTTCATHEDGTRPGVDAGTAHQPAGHEDPAEEQRRDLLGEAPARLDPLPELVLRVPAGHHPEEGDEQRRGERPVHAVDRGEEAHRLVRRAPVGEDEDRDHGAEEGGVLPPLPRTRGPGGRGGEGVGAVSLPLGLLAAEEGRHEDADDHGEEHRPDRPREAELQAQHPRGEDHGEDVDRRARVEEGRRRAEAGAPPVDRGEEGQHRAGADGEDAARDGGDAVGHRPRGLRPEVAQHRALAHELADRPRDEERGHEAQQDVLPRVVLQQPEALEERPLHARALDGQEEGEGEDPHEQDELPALGHLRPRTTARGPGRARRRARTSRGSRRRSDRPRA